MLDPPDTGLHKPFQTTDLPLISFYYVTEKQFAAPVMIIIGGEYVCHQLFCALHLFLIEINLQKFGFIATWQTIRLSARVMIVSAGF